MVANGHVCFCPLLESYSMFKAAKARKNVGPRRHKPMLEVLRVASNIGKEGQHVWPPMVMFFWVPSYIHIQYLKPPNSPKRFGPKCHKLLLVLLRVISDVGKEGQNAWLLAPMAFWVPSYPHIQLNNPSRPQKYLNQNAINQCQQYYGSTGCWERTP